MLRIIGLVGLALALLGGCRRAVEPAPATVDDRPEQRPPAEPEPPAEPPTCDGQPCEAPRECVRYFGIAGPRGPEFEACERRCERGVGDNDGCPEGTRCVTIADGPGDVCR